MHKAQGNLFTRPDTMFGVCEAIGRDLGFHPNILRVALAVPLIWTPLLMCGIYAALGVLVLASRLIAPEPKPVGEPIRSEAVADEPAPAVEDLRRAA